jgi:processive 1,2-diacylglycerol beta-glucosyltransferase
MAQKKVLLLSVSAGAGHARAAEAIRSCASAADAEITAIHLDAMAFVTPRLRKTYTDFYNFLVKRAPNLCSTASVALVSTRFAGSLETSLLNHRRAGVTGV